MMLPILHKERDEAIKEFNTWIAELDSSKIKTGRVSLEELLREIGLDNFDKVIGLFLTWWKLEGENWFAEKYGKTVRVESKFAEDGNKYLTWDEMIQAEKDLLEDNDYGINLENVEENNVNVEENNVEENVDKNVDKSVEENIDKSIDVNAKNKSKSTSFFTDDDDDFDF